jgi:hypothetical protein
LALALAAGVCGAGAQYCPAGSPAPACDRVLVACAEVPSTCADVQSKLRDTGAFAVVDTFLAQSSANGGAGTPTAAQLAAYDAVLVFSNYLFADSALLGDRLATYHDQGGGVVVAMFGNGNAVWGATNLQGA